MKNCFSLRKASVFVLMLIAIQLCLGLAWPQKQRRQPASDRRLKVSKQPDADQPQQQEDQDSPAPVSDKPQLVVKLGHYALSAAFSPDGRLILTSGSDRKVILWDIATGAEIRRFIGDSFAFSPDGRIIVTANFEKNTVRLWDAATGAETRRLDGVWVAFSPDGNSILTVNTTLYKNGRKLNDDNVARLWDISTGKLLRSFAGHSGTVSSLTFSPDGRFVLTGSHDNTARLWDAATGQEIRRFEGHSDAVVSVGFSYDGRFALTRSQYPYHRDSSKDRSVRLWDAATGKEIRRFEKADYPVAFSRDGRFLLAGATDKEATAVLLDTATGEEVRRFDKASNPVGLSPDDRFILTIANHAAAVLWDAASGQRIQIFGRSSSSIQSVAFSPDGQQVLAGSWDRSSAQLWSMTTGQQVRRFAADSGTVGSVAFSPDARLVLTGGYDYPVRLWDAATGAEVRRFNKADHAAFSPDGRFVATSGLPDGREGMTLWDVSTGKEIRRFNGRIVDIAFSPDGRFLVTGGYDKTARLWDVATGKEQRQFKGLPIWLGTGTAVAFSPDGRFVLFGSGTHAFYPDNAARLWNAATGQQLRRFSGHSNTVLSVKFSTDGRFVLTGSRDGTARLWDSASGKQVRSFEGHTASVNSVAFSPDGRFVLTGSDDSTTRLWQAATGKELCRLLTFNDGNWVAVTSEGRFDTSNLDGLEGLSWIMPDDPFRPLPLEIFMRDYYEPRLLPRILAGEKFKPIKSLSDLNRVQPVVIITSIQPQGNNDTVSVTVDVSKASDQFQRGGKKITVETGVYDLRLFRDGQMVGYAPKPDGEITMDSGANKQTITFRNVRLPRKKETAKVEFSAYAFNVDGIKSATDRRVFELPKELTPLKGRAYLITVGVNAYEQEDFDLNFAANDARRVQSTVFDRLSKTAEYEDVVQIPLISDYEIRGGKKVVTEKSATKKNLEVVLDLLSGKYVGPELKRDIPNANKIRRARPEDLVLISFASHGFADDNGNFYFVPYDTGQVTERRITDEFMRRCISSEELSLWLRDVDAGEMVMIADACHSAATVDVEGFKPGPMGSRGLGQLAYDKRMRILTSTQADDVALESELIKQGLLTYALTHDGIEAGQADFKPKDKTITLAEWLEYGVSRVPALYEEVKRGELQSFGQGAEKRGLVHSAGKKNSDTSSASSVKRKGYQQPSLFDFSRKKYDVALVKGN